MTDETGGSHNAEISAFELLNLMRRGWKTIALCLVLGAVAAGARIVLTPKVYEAVAMIRIGQTGQIGGIDATGLLVIASQPIEDPAQVMERMKTAQFQRRVAENLDDQAWIQDIEQSSLSGSFSLVLLKNGQEPNQMPLIELRTEAPNPKTARQKLEAVAAELIRTQAEFATAAIEHLRANLDWVQVRLAIAERSLVELTKVEQAGKSAVDRFLLEMPIPLLRVDKEAKISELRQMAVTLDKALQSPTTRPTELIESAYAPIKLVRPKPLFLLAIGIFSGLLAGTLWVVVKDGIRRLNRYSWTKPWTAGS